LTGFARIICHEELQWTRDALVWKLDGLSEYDIRRPLTVTGTNLLGLVKHMATWGARYLGEIFSRHSRALHGGKTPTVAIYGLLKARAASQIVGFYRRAGGTQTPQFVNYPLTLPATCRGGAP